MKHWRIDGIIILEDTDENRKSLTVANNNKTQFLVGPQDGKVSLMFQACPAHRAPPRRRLRYSQQPIVEELP